MKKEIGNYKLDVKFKKITPTTEFKTKLKAYNKLRKRFDGLTSSEKITYQSLINYLKAK